MVARDRKIGGEKREYPREREVKNELDPNGGWTDEDNRKREWARRMRLRYYDRHDVPKMQQDSVAVPEVPVGVVNQSTRRRVSQDSYLTKVQHGLAFFFWAIYTFLGFCGIAFPHDPMDYTVLYSFTRLFLFFLPILLVFPSEYSTYKPTKCELFCLCIHIPLLCIWCFGVHVVILLCMPIPSFQLAVLILDGAIIILSFEILRKL